ncbi:hypothetical protein J7T55_011322 [Diaporthe amygdali]|uniref:uncharacterized protein n=1 Tax=Phomopsis amygdali TaxID=1214568 RepID=UPI0022FDF3C8|nr:uncharacterized protein J7T55_011322 [Diaporthe amygdali]KAJ0108831.1 hypothetical protein J7T55_011322 [Diaporthe amygdali]
MASRSDTVFPLIPAPMALAVDTLSAAAATTSRRSPAPSRATTTSADRITTPNTPATAAAETPGATTKRAKNPRHPIFNEDIFSRFYTTPFLVFHFAIYGAIPFYYLLHYSPFRDFGGGTLNHVVKWALFVLTQYITAVIVTSWNGRYRVQKDVTACALMLVGLAGLTGLKALVDGMAASKG